MTQIIIDWHLTPATLNRGLSLQPLFHDPCSNMRFLLDTGAHISMIPPCRFYKPYYGPQDLIIANGSPIRIFGTKKGNIDVGARYTLRWIFTVTDVSLPIIGIDFMRHFGLGVDMANNAFILPRKSIYRRHHAPRTRSHPKPCISGPNANDAFDSPSTSPRLSDIPNKFRVNATRRLNRVTQTPPMRLLTLLTIYLRLPLTRPSSTITTFRLFFKSPKIRQ